MASLILAKLGASAVAVILLASASVAFIPNGNGLIPQNIHNKVMCTGTSLMIYYDCRVCVCPKSHRAARCFRKSCDLRVKDSGQCPPSVLKIDDDQLCPKPSQAPTCKTDNDCPGASLCCFDFCYGARCMDSIPLDPGMTKHQGRGYP